MPLKRHEGLQRARRTGYRARGFQQDQVPKHGQQLMQQGSCNETIVLLCLPQRFGILAKMCFRVSIHGQVKMGPLLKRT